MNWQGETSRGAQQPHKGMPAFSTQSGRSITLQVLHHHDQMCKEFIVTSPVFSYSKWLIWTAIFNVIGYAAQIHTQDSRVMTAAVLILLLLLAIKLHFKVYQESLLVMKSVGVQLKTTFASGRTKAKFYDIHQVEDIVINEAVTMHRVLYYLTMLLREQPTSTLSSLVPLYKHSWPSLACLTEIYRGAQTILKSHDHSS